MLLSLTLGFWIPDPTLPRYGSDLIKSADYAFLFFRKVLSSCNRNLVGNRSHMIVGTEWIIDAIGCPAEALSDLEKLQAVFGRLIVELNLQVIGDAVWQKFPPPGGVTGLALLTESHLTCHTYPEFNIATFNLYCCRARPAWPWPERLSEMLGAQEVRVRVLRREASLGAALFKRSAGVSGKA